MSKTNCDFSLIIPCYNEEASITKLIEACLEIDNCEEKIQFIFVNNGSTDLTGVLLLEKSKSLRNCKVLQYTTNLGYGGGILFGLKNAEAPLLAWTHADLQTPVDDVLKAFMLYQAADPKPLLIKGARVERPWVDILFSRLMSFCSLIFNGNYLTEINAQPKLFSRNFFESIEEDCPSDFGLDLFVVLRAKKKGPIVEFPVRFFKRKSGIAKGGGGGLLQKIKLSLRTLKYMRRLR